MTQIYFIRHGESEGNASETWATWDSPLTKTGRAQALNAAQTAAKDGIRFDVIYSSPQPRALETAQIVATELQYPIENIIIEHDLRERNFGNLIGTQRKDFFKDHTYQDIDNVANVESLADVQSRAELVLETVQKNEGTVLLVAHAAVGRAILRILDDNHVAKEDADPNVVLNQVRNAEIMRLAA